MPFTIHSSCLLCNASLIAVLCEVTVSLRVNHTACQLCMNELEEAGVRDVCVSHERTSVQASSLGDWPHRDITMMVLF